MPIQDARKGLPTHVTPHSTSTVMTHELSLPSMVAQQPATPTSHGTTIACPKLDRVLTPEGDPDQTLARVSTPTVDKRP
jgi:hypothetical protein